MSWQRQFNFMKPNYRRCVSCRRIFPKEQLWRVVKAYPDQQILLDSGMGRSAYLCPNESCLQKARQKKQLQRSLKTPIPQQIYQCLQARLESPTLPVRKT